MLPVYRHTGLSPSSYQAVVFLGQFLLIPGLAALLSRIMHGRDGWGRRTLTIFALGFAAPVLVVLILFPIFLLAWVFSISVVLFAVLLPLVVGLIAAALILVIRKTGGWSIHREATRWLAERQWGTDPSERRWRKRGIRWSTWVPCTMVLLVFLFLPEIWGMLSHLSQPRAGSLLGYRVPIPVTWIVLDHGDHPADGGSGVRGLAGRGIGLGVKPYVHADLPLSAWDIRTEPEPGRHWVPKEDDVIGRRVFAVGSESVTCVEYWPPYKTRPEHIEDSSFAYIQCLGSSRLSASIVGDRTHVPAFYRMLEGITPAK